MEYPDFEAMFDEAFQSMSEASGETRPELAYTSKGDGTTTFINPNRQFNREVFVHTRIGGNLKPAGSVSLDTKAGIFYEDSEDNVNRPVWIVTRKGRRMVTDLALVQGTIDSDGLTPLEQKIRNIETVKASNLTAGDVSAGDVGYLSYSATDGIEFLRTSTAELDSVAWAVALNSSSSGDVQYAARRGRYYLNYTGTAPTKGQFLTTSASTGLVQARTLFHPAVMAVAVGNGQSGKVLAQLLTGSQRYWQYNTNAPFNLVGPVSDSVWTGTINGAPSSTLVTVTTSTGALVNFGPQATTDLLKTRLRNTTRGNYRLVTATNPGANQISTVASTDNWASTDLLTIESGTVVSGGSNKFIDLDVSQFQAAGFPKLARAIIIAVFFRDTAAASQGFFYFHPFRSYNVQFVQSVASIPGNLGTSVVQEVPLNDELLTWSIDATGATTASVFTRYLGYVLAIP